MAKPKLRMFLNILLALIICCYVSLIWVIDINMLGAVIYSILFFGLLILRDIIAPKQKRSDKNGNN
uniref:Uncharacterized protein n=1 Tax=Staphylococcus sp. 693-2 TaxID=373067 RepID=D2J5V8_9STAP|nr:hypothetical protein [Staphylococcus sp. 693-2]ADA61239.1 hypothetical protein SAP008A_011 [Staphylococcus sp. 693-2]